MNNENIDFDYIPVRDLKIGDVFLTRYKDHRVRGMTFLAMVYDEFYIEGENTGYETLYLPILMLQEVLAGDEFDSAGRIIDFYVGTNGTNQDHWRFIKIN